MAAAAILKEVKQP